MTSETIQFNSDVCSDLQRASSLEWLETNGLGGFACGTVAGIHTRRYHGLLTAATKPPVGRLLLLSKLEETLLVDGRRYDLSTNRYPGAIHPDGYRYLKEFRLDPLPTWLYRMDGVEIEKQVFLVSGENTVVVRYGLRTLDRDPAPVCTLEIRPLIAFRDYHSTTHRNDDLNTSVTAGEGLAVITPYRGLPSLWFSHDAANIEATGHWYHDVEYSTEQERGLDYREDLFNPFVATYALSRSTAALVIGSTEPQYAADAEVLREREIQRRAQIAAAAPVDDPLVRALTSAADQFIVKRGDLKTVVAGYPWFSDWGRDTMIALPGLTLVTGRTEVARDILLTFAEAVDKGMLPNRFPDDGEAPEYNTVDATLWFFEAIRAYLAYTGDIGFVEKRFYPKLKEILNAHLRGTRYGIRVDNDGLLHCGEPGVQLTWMDAKIGDCVVTPRNGKPVEIQALWYNALRITEELAVAVGDTATQTFLTEMASLARASFNEQFWYQDGYYLYDVVDGENRDASMRPNQILAASLHHSMLDPIRAQLVVDAVHDELWTPHGLRSLARHDPQYHAHYDGGVYERDSAYHQGTVWPWLMGPFVTAWTKVHGREGSAQLLDGFREHLREGCLGQISEILDGDEPRMPRGCFAQAWSVSELLRALVEDVHGRAPAVRESAVLAARV
ncbi:MAG: amylo-alpha-1,6-glucosidase [Bryobacteraceae bacterium]